MNLRHLRLLLLVFLLLAVPGCALPTPLRLATPTQLPVSTPAPALKTPTSLPVTLTPSAALKPGQAHPILVFPSYDTSGGFLLGAARDGAWLSAKDTAALLLARENYTLYSWQARLGNAAGGEPVAQMTCPSFWFVSIDHPAGLAAALGADWNALPRVPREVDVNEPQAVQKVQDYLTALGVSQPEVKIQRILEADLEGDGTPEFLVSASRFTEETGHDVEPGDYSIILLYRAGQAALPVLSEVYTRAAPLSFPDRFDLSAALDLNGDGRLEILIAVTGWEKTGALAYTVDGDALKNVLLARCP